MSLFLQPNWPAPSTIHAYTTLRMGGVSQAPYDEFNLATHVGDNPEHVIANRELLKKTLAITSEPIWIKQTHSARAIPATAENAEQEADATFTDKTQQTCVVLTADCLPILLCNHQGTHVAAIHAGWRGIAHGIIEATIAGLSLPSHDLLAWLGPAISPANYEVGAEIRSQFIDLHPEAELAFQPSPNQRWLADLYALAKIRLLRQGISAIYGGNFCTYADNKRFYSYRRDGEKTGRMATLIWINEQAAVR